MSATDLPRTSDLRYDLRQRLDRGVRWLREAEDIARIEMPGWPTADRIREIYEQVTADVLNGRTSVPPLQQRHDEAVAERDSLLREVERLREEIKRAPHARHCEAATDLFPGPCNCWKRAALTEDA